MPRRNDPRDLTNEYYGVRIECRRCRTPGNDQTHHEPMSGKVIQQRITWVLVWAAALIVPLQPLASTGCFCAQIAETTCCCARDRSTEAESTSVSCCGAAVEATAGSASICCEFEETLRHGAEHHDFDCSTCMCSQHDPAGEPPAPVLPKVTDSRDIVIDTLCVDIATACAGKTERHSDESNPPIAITSLERCVSLSRLTL